MQTKVKLEPAFWFLGLVFLHNVNANFNCPAQGRFLDPLSDCKEFFFCYFENSELLYVTYKCPEGKLFSVEERRCITASNLECKELTGATPMTIQTKERDPLDGFNCRSEGNFVNEFDPDCKSYITCTRLWGYSYSLNLLYCPREELFSQDTLQCVPNHQFVCPSDEPMSDESNPTTESSQQTSSTPQEFICTRTGRFPNLAEPGCGTYILCAQTQNGTFISQAYYCENSLFDPDAGKCIVGYICRDKIAPDSISGITYDIETTAISSNDPASKPSEFICTKTGRFPNLSDAGCRSYILCSRNENGTFNSHSYVCYNSYFDPDTRRCSLEYNCQNDYVTITIPTEEITVGSNLPSTQLSTTTENEQLNTTQSSAEIEILTVTVDLASSDVTEGQTISTPHDFVCTRTGRFPNLAEPGCRTYILCSPTPDGTFISQAYNCDNSLFDPNARRCSLEYICLDDNTTTTVSEITHSTDLPSTQKDESTTIAVTLYSTPSGELSTITTTIPGNTTVNEQSSTAQNEVTISTDDPNSSFADDVTRVTTTTTTSSYAFKCTRTGKFPNLSVAGCGSYILCIEIDGTFNAYTYSCYNSYFDPNTRRCSLKYVCPDTYVTTPIDEGIRDSTPQKDELPTTKIELSTFSNPTRDDITDSEELSDENTVTSSAVTTTQSSIELTTVTELPGSSPIDFSTHLPRCMVDPISQFICPNTGKYKDANSSDCKTYILCLRTVKGELVYAKLKCNEGTLYSDEMRNCVSTENYSCST